MREKSQIKPCRGLCLVLLLWTMLVVVTSASAQSNVWEIKLVTPSEGASNRKIFSINDFGVEAGEEYFPSTVATKAFRNGPNGFTFLDPAQYQYTSGQAINNSNVVAGIKLGDDAVLRLLKWDGGVETYLGQLEGMSASQVVDINDSSVIVGISSNSSSILGSGWVWENGVLTPLPFPVGYGFEECIPTAINNAGVIVGYCKDNTSGDAGRTTGFVWQPNLSVSEIPTYINLSNSMNIPHDINNRGEIVGSISAPFNAPGLSPISEAPGYWSSYLAAPRLLPYPKYGYSRGWKVRHVSGEATSINDFGNIVGNISLANKSASNYMTGEHSAFWYNKDSLVTSFLSIGSQLPLLNTRAAEREINNCLQINSRSETYYSQSSSHYTSGYLVPGQCVCGVNTIDANNNSIVDCLEPTTGTVPPKPFLSRRGAVVIASFMPPPPGLGFKTKIRVYNKKGKQVASKTVTSHPVEFKKLFGKTRKYQKLSIRADIIWTNGIISTRPSGITKFSFKVK